MDIYIFGMRIAQKATCIPNVGDYICCQGRVISRTFDYSNNRVILEVSND